MELCKQLIDQIARDYEQEILDNIPVYMVLDNARYQRANLVQEYAKQKKILLTFLPPYCPHLNLIERLWKWLKKKIRNKYFSTFKLFSDAIHAIL
jgi:transposase